MVLPFTFLGILLVSFLIVFLLSRPRAAERTIGRRLEGIRVSRSERESEAEALAPVVAGQGVVARVGELLARFRFADHLAVLIRHSGSDTSVGAIVFLSLGGAAGGAVVARSFSLPLPLIWIAGLAGGSARYLLLRMQKGKRLKKFGRALPDAIELMARALRAGHSMASSIEIISEQSPQPLRGEFAICFQQQKFGIPFRDTLLEMAQRVPSKDLHFLITAVLVQKETGGDLTEILDRTTVVIRERVRIEGEIKTYTAQGRLTGWIFPASRWRC